MLVFEVLIKERECHALAWRIEVLGRYHYLIIYLEPCFFLFVNQIVCATITRSHALGNLNPGDSPYGNCERQVYYVSYLCNNYIVIWLFPSTTYSGFFWIIVCDQ